MFSNPFPTIQAKDYVLRNYTLDDLPLVERASQDNFIPLITSIPAVYTKEAGESFIKRQISRYENKQGYAFAIAQQCDNEAIGALYLGLNNIGEGRASIGYWLLEKERGKNIAGTCLKALTDWIEINLKIPRLELYVEPWNHASIKTAKSVGFQEEGIMRIWQQVGEERKDMIMMSLIYNY